MLHTLRTGNPASMKEALCDGAGGNAGEWDAPQAVPEPSTSQKGEKVSVPVDLAARVVIHDMLDRIQGPVIRLLQLALARVANPQVTPVLPLLCMACTYTCHPAAPVLQVL